MKIEKFDIEIKTLDEIYKKVENAYLKYDYFLKLDTQGNDLSVLKGAKNFIKNSQPIIFCELIYVPLYENQSYAHEIINYMMENQNRKEIFTVKIPPFEMIVPSKMN